MSIVSDMDLYYRNSYLGIKSGNSILPFLVRNTFVNHDITDQDGYEEEELTYQLQSHHDEIKHCLSFEGIVTTGSNGNGQVSMTYRLDDVNLVMEIPDAGYICIEDSWKWISYTSVHSAKKGLVKDKIPILFGNSSNLQTVVFKLYNWEPSLENPHRDLLKRDGKVFYRGIKIGTVNGNNVTINQSAKYVTCLINQYFPDLIVSLAE